tara:strand:+ start:261 stop:980 length:720 start_codon:yes stop_codon:yes gene_type:complete
MSSEELNSIPEDSGSQESTPAPAAAEHKIDTASIIAQAKQAALSEVQNIPGFKQYQDYEKFKNQEVKAPNPFDSEIGLGNITDATQHLYGQLTADQQKMHEYNEKVSRLEAKEAARDYEVCLDQLTNYWEDKYDNEDSFINAINEAVPYLPRNLQQQFAAATSKQGYLDSNFIANLDQAMKNLWIYKLDDPSSGALDSLLAQKAQRKALQDQSMLSSNSQTSDSGKQTDNYSAVVKYYD